MKDTIKRIFKSVFAFFAQAPEKRSVRSQKPSGSIITTKDRIKGSVVTINLLLLPIRSRRLRPALPAIVDPDHWLLALDGRWYPRLVKKDGRIQVDGTYYSIKADLAGHHIMLRLSASTRCFDVFRGQQFVKSVPIKGLLGKRMPLEEYIDGDSENARVPKNVNGCFANGACACRLARALEECCASASAERTLNPKPGTHSSSFSPGCLLFPLVRLVSSDPNHPLSTSDAPHHAWMFAFSR